jgi:hypothetical protein
MEKEKLQILKLREFKLFYGIKWFGKYFFFFIKNAPDYQSKQFFFFFSLLKRRLFSKTKDRF